MDVHRLERFVEGRLRASGLPGAVVGLVRADAEPWLLGIGLRDLARRLPAGPDTLYGWASLTKSFTAVAVLQLAERGRLALDDPLARHLPVELGRADQPVTLAHLLSHASGIPALGYAEHVIHATMADQPPVLRLHDAADVTAFARDAAAWATDPPGTRWMYLNEGYVMLGRVVAAVSGLPYETYLRRHLLEPLRMTRTVFERDRIVGDADHASAYAVRPDGPAQPCGFPIEALGATGGLYGSARDLARWCRLLMRGGELDGVRLLSADGIDAMTTPRLPVAVRDAPYGPVRYGYGLRVQDDFLGRRLVEHSGAVGAFTSWFGWLPAERLGAVVLTNGSGHPTINLGTAVLAEALGVACDTLPPARRDALLERLCGTYRSWQGAIEWQVRRSGDLLRVDTPGGFGGTRLLVPERLEADRCRFFQLDNGSRLDAEFRIDGRAIDLQLERYRLRRVDEPARPEPAG